MKGRRTIWLAADPNGIAHCQVSGHSLCGAAPTAERDAWPTLHRCPRCLALRAALTDARLEAPR